MFRDLVLGKKKLVSGAKRFEDSKELSDSVSDDPDGIGFVGLPYVGSTSVVAIYDKGTTERTQPLKPSATTINQRTYLLQRELYFYVSPNSTNKLAKDLVVFAKSPAGQDIAKEVGFVSQNIIPTNTGVERDVSLRSDIPAKLAEIKRNYKEFPTRFYFRSGSYQLDNKSLDDFDRIAKFLEQQGGKDVVLVGFTDNRGSPDKNLTYSIERARAVEKEFAKVGVTCQVNGFGKEAPNFSNDKPEGQEKNRRVEIYYR
jgi:phosphate transport system substrate-binding protein